MFKVQPLAGGEVVRYRMARILLGKPVHIASCYRIGNVLVDAGAPNRVRELRHALKGQRIRSVLVTHGHEDHAGNAAHFRGADIRGAPGLRISSGLPFYRRVAWGEPAPGGVVRPIGAGLDAGDHQYLPLPTPGHTPDHLAYWEPDRGWLFAGDAALGPLKYGFRDEDIHAYLRSLKAMRDRKPEVVFPAHGPVLEQPQEQLGAQIQRLEALRDEARRLARDGLSEGAIARRLLGFDGVLGMVSGGEFRKALLIRGLLRPEGTP
jgi:glyoxylase-like metal-dependent hydrolase (beta-lactamase superfamily II)